MSQPISSSLGCGPCRRVVVAVTAVGVSLAVGKLVGALLTPRANIVVFPCLSSLPSLGRCAFLLLFGHRRRSAAKSEEAPRAEVVVEAVEASNVWPALSLCGTGLSAAVFIVPHVLAQTSWIVLSTHAAFPVSLIGALHARSFIHVPDVLLLRRVLTDLAASGSGPQPSLSAALVGTRPVSKGTEVIIVLSLFSAQRALLWRETLVVFTSRRSRPLSTSGTGEALPLPQLSDERSEQLCPPALEAALRIPVDSRREGATAAIVSKSETWRYGVVSGDVNPIHMSDLGARLFLGERSRIVHGMHLLGCLLQRNESEAWLSNVLEESDGALSAGIAFRKPVRCGTGVCAVRGEVTPTVSGMDVTAASDSSKVVCCVRIQRGLASRSVAP